VEDQEPKRRYTPSEKAKIVEGALKSGDWTGAAQEHGVSLSSLLDWKRRILKTLAPGVRVDTGGTGYLLEKHILESEADRKRISKLVVGR
jgi:transposase-like protein